jgi:uncharacterized protein YjbI with pentapeptide repeats
MPVLKDMRTMVVDTTFDYFDLSDCDLRGVNFNDAELTHTKFDWSDLRGASFIDANISGEATFAFANLDGADFRGANLNLVAFEFANLNEAIFDEGIKERIIRLYNNKF